MTALITLMFCLGCSPSPHHLNLIQLKIRLDPCPKKMDSGTSNENLQEERKFGGVNMTA